MDFKRSSHAERSFSAYSFGTSSGEEEAAYTFSSEMLLMSAAIEEVIWRRTIDRRRFRKHRPLVFSETKQLFASAEESSSFLVVE
jgi:hypothetical protein